MSVYGTTTKTYFEEYLPKDIIEYLRKFTGPIDIWYIKSSASYWNGQHYVRRYGYLGKSEEEMKKIASRYDNHNTKASYHECKIVFVDGHPYRLYPIDKLINMPRVVKKPKQKSRQCTGKTKKNKRCKTKTMDDSRLCHIHRDG